METNVFVVFQSASLSNWYFACGMQLCVAFLVSQHLCFSSTANLCVASIAVIMQPPTLWRTRRLIGPWFVVATSVFVVIHPAQPVNKRNSPLQYYFCNHEQIRQFQKYSPLSNIWCHYICGGSQCVCGHFWSVEASCHRALITLITIPQLPSSAPAPPCCCFSCLILSLVIFWSTVACSASWL